MRAERQRHGDGPFESGRDARYLFIKSAIAAAHRILPIMRRS